MNREKIFHLVEERPVDKGRKLWYTDLNFKEKGETMRK